MRHTRLPYLGLAIAMVAGSALAQMPEPPINPDTGEPSRDLPEPQVTAYQTEDSRILEYRVNGALYMVRVEPEGGQAYYLLDTVGDGEFDQRGTWMDENMIPVWVLFQF